MAPKLFSALPPCFLEMPHDPGIDGNSVIGVEIAAVAQVVADGARLITCPGTESSHQSFLVEQTELACEQSDLKCDYLSPTTRRRHGIPNEASGMTLKGKFTDSKLPNPEAIGAARPIRVLLVGAVAIVFLIGGLILVVRKLHPFVQSLAVAALFAIIYQFGIHYRLVGERRTRESIRQQNRDRGRSDSGTDKKDSLPFVDRDF
jgi:hypothetical protein